MHIRLLLALLLTLISFCSCDFCRDSGISVTVEKQPDLSTQKITFTVTNECQYHIGAASYANVELLERPADKTNDGQTSLSPDNIKSKALSLPHSGYYVYDFSNFSNDQSVVCVHIDAADLSAFVEGCSQPVTLGEDDGSSAIAKFLTDAFIFIVVAFVVLLIIICLIAVCVALLLLGVVWAAVKHFFPGLDMSDMFDFWRASMGLGGDGYDHLDDDYDDYDDTDYGTTFPGPMLPGMDGFGYNSY
ncbi:Prokaryotic membrane lipoprotein lipid attachment site [Carpediemonas membranifera]|uniref:Prokaryotic membrane lipoprotein lipid attachment site n=1 Tax=Carpediemonas membranifera TaxID=201153 RepID=A0A8J6B700_9EUKA|nr:Prokaryotic membrane lipoprotein lipid attachment site [Carpediemonas membranifera]|eukprot:KAG9396978.1 Prokaryotic membrane lipoprotein lipid attachment site [Carpediemonas membranifera]